MNQDKHLNRYNSETAKLRILALAFFAPIYFSDGKFSLNTAMVSTYASIYMKRNIIAAMLTFTGGELVDKAGFTLLGTVILGMFVVFAGLCSVYTAAMFEKNRNHS